MTRYRVLVTDSLAASGLDILKKTEDVDLDYRPGLKGEELLQAVRESDALITRSGTAVTHELVNAGSRLRVIGRAGVGLDNVDVEACTARGILVINAPTANIMSATEHTMAMLLALCRNIPEAHASVKRGEWSRSKFMGIELHNKTLGVIGLGRIGSRVTTRARGFGMRVVAYDPYVSDVTFEKVGAENVTLDELLALADVITVHTPLTDETRALIGANEIEKMKPGVVVLNIARGGIYEEQALADALNSGKVAGAAIDVYVEEPPGPAHPFLNAKNVILSPHIGANTIEAQDRVAVTTAEMVVEALRGSIFVSAVNLPFEGLSDADAAPLIRLAEKLGSFAAQILKGAVDRAAIELWGIEERLTKILSVASLKGLLTPHSADVNFVNAEQTAQSRGIALTSSTQPMPLDYSNLITFRASSRDEEFCVSGTVFHENNQRIVQVNNFRVEFKPEGHVIYLINRDVPGVVGKVGTLLGDREINIAEYNLARHGSGGKAMAIITVDSPLDAETLNFLRSYREMVDVRQVRL
ncbi:MAG TPA: phosphoglycerate dehydrogenase [Thermoanaerobaculia bacterium]